MHSSDCCGWLPEALLYAAEFEIDKDNLEIIHSSSDTWLLMRSTTIALVVESVIRYAGLQVKLATGVQPKVPSGCKAFVSSHCAPPLKQDTDSARLN